MDQETSLEISEDNPESPESREVQETEDNSSEEFSSPGMEAKARDMGWVPQDEFRGNPDNWRPADEFVKRGEEFLPFIKKDRDKFREKADGLEARLEKLESDHAQKLERLEHMSNVGIQELRSQYESQFAALKRQAVREGDEEAYDAYERQERDALADLDKKAAPPEPKDDDKPQITESQKQVLDGWLGDNAWFNADAEMRAVATARHEKLLTDKPGMTLEENLQETREYVKSKYPEKFGATKANGRGSPVEGGGRAGGGASTLWGRLDKDVRAIADRQIKNGQFARSADGKALETLQAKRERYAELYFGDEA